MEMRRRRTRKKEKNKKKKNGWRESRKVRGRKEKNENCHPNCPLNDNSDLRDQGVIMVASNKKK